MSKKLLLVLLSLACFASPVLGQTSASDLLDQAEQLAVAGKLLEANQRWEAALKQYEKMGDREGVMQTIAPLARTQQLLGYPLNACHTLVGGLNADDQLCNPNTDGASTEIPNTAIATPLEIEAQITLANILREIGQFEPATQILGQTLDRAERMGEPDLIADTHLAIAQIKFLEVKIQHDRAKLRGQPWNDSGDLVQIGYQHYEAAMEGRNRVYALLGWTGLYEELIAQSGTNNATFDQSSQYAQYLYELANLDFSSFSPVEQIQLGLVLANQLRQDESKQRTFQRLQEILNVAQDLQIAEYLAESYASFGRLYEYDSQPELAVAAYQRAIQTAPNHSNRYAWEYQIAQLYAAQGSEASDQTAMIHYKNAIAEVEEIQWEITPLSREMRVQFQGSIRPIFDGYLALLLKQDIKDFAQVLNVREQFRLAELQNYLRCGTLTPIRSEEIFEADPEATVITVLDLDAQHYHVILQDRLGYQETVVEATPVDEALSAVRTALEDEQFRIPDSLLSVHLSSLYKNLLGVVPDRTKGTLVFSLPPKLQSVPMAMLLDEEGKYLIENHSIAYLGEKLYTPKPLSDKQRQDVLFAGIAESTPRAPEFLPLLGVDMESTVVNSKQKLLNQEFTADRFLSQLQLRPRPIVHVATHGQFSSAPDQTFLLAWDQKLSAESLNVGVRDRAERAFPIELLILSACQTAKGDPLAPLGIAGMSINAGSRSTLASLWKAEDTATAELMREFYAQLGAGQSKAEALRQAQLSLLRGGRSSPYYWGNFVLLGSWL